MEGVVDGSIFYYNMFSKSQPRNRIWVSEVDSRSTSIMDQQIVLLNNKMPAYQLVNGEEKDKLAMEIYMNIFILRSFGVIQNNPDSIKELQFFKSRCEKLELEKQRLEEKVSNLSTKLLQLVPSPDPKIGTA